MWISGDDPVYLSFTGVDDYMDVFVDGVFIGSGGDLERRETAFELRTSFPLPPDSARSGEIEIAVRVFDWYGAGGIFRPVSLSTRPIRPGAPILVPAETSPGPGDLPPEGPAPKDPTP